MKKFFSLIALVGVFAACQKEDLKTAFSVEPAVATITAHAMFLDGSTISSNISYTFGGGESGNVNTCTFYGPEYGSLSKDVTVGVKWTGYDGKRSFSDSKTVKVDVLAGGQANYDVYFILGTITDEDGYEYWVKTDEDELDPKIYWLDKAMHGGHEFEDPETGEKGWYLKNATEFILRGTVDYTMTTGEEPATTLNWYTDVTLPEFQKLYDDMKLEKTKETLNITVSAWADYVVFQTVESSWVDVTLMRTDLNGIDEEFAGFSYIVIDSNKAEYYERAAEGHEAHYVEGHGIDDPAHSHGHGSSNAGGGIVYGD